MSGTGYVFAQRSFVMSWVSRGGGRRWCRRWSLSLCNTSSKLMLGRKECRFNVSHLGPGPHGWDLNGYTVRRQSGNSSQVKQPLINRW